MFIQHPVKNVCAKFKVDCFSRFRTGARQVFTIQKPILSEIPLTMETATPNSLLTYFLIKLSSAKFLLKSVHPSCQKNSFAPAKKNLFELLSGISLF